MIDFEAKPLRRREDGRLLTGTGRYTADLALSDTLHVAFVRSHHAHATIRGIDTSEARSMPSRGDGIRRCRPGGVRPIPGGIGFPRPDGSPAPKTDRAILASDRVRFVGEPVAAVLARSRSDAQDAAEAVMVDYDSQPAVIDPLQALEAGAPQVWDIAPGGIAIMWKGSGPGERRRQFGPRRPCDPAVLRCVPGDCEFHRSHAVRSRASHPMDGLRSRPATEGHGLKMRWPTCWASYRPGARGDP